jgi:hypothetical protein
MTRRSRAKALARQEFEYHSAIFGMIANTWPIDIILMEE